MVKHSRRIIGAGVLLPANGANIRPVVHALLLHAFTKKTQQTPASEIVMAERRYEDSLKREETQRG